MYDNNILWCNCLICFDMNKLGNEMNESWNEFVFNEMVLNEQWMQWSLNVHHNALKPN